MAPTPRPTPRPAQSPQPTPPPTQSAGTGGSEETDPDLPLIEAIRRGETSAWKTLLTSYQDRVFALCLGKVGHRELAADLTQDVMVKLLQHLDSYDGRARLSTWVYRITLNVCYSKLRSEKYRRHASLDSGRDRPGADPEPAAEAGLAQTRELSGVSRVEMEDERRLLLAALARLDEEHRDILLLRDSRGLDYEQIAEVLGVAVGTVKSRLFRARVALREAMENKSGGGAGDGG